MTDGEIHLVWDSRSSFHYENNYYNYTTTVVKYIDKEGKEHIMSTKSEIFDNREVQSEYVWDTWNISKGTAGDPSGETARDNKNSIVENGGVAFYSSKGQGQESRITLGVVDMVDIGPILDAIGAFSPGGGMQKKLDKVFKQLDMGKDMEALKDAMSVMGNIMETYGDAFEKGHNLEEAIEKAQRKSSRTESLDSASCIHCGSTIDKETLRGSGNADFKHRQQSNDD